MVVAWIVAIGCATAVSAGPQDALGAVEEPLVEIRQVLRLAPEDAAASRRVDVRGIVTFTDPVGSDFFLQLGEQAIWVSHSSGMRLARGDLVNVKGVTSRGTFAPNIDPDHEGGVTILGKEALPAPAVAEQLGLANGEHDCRLIAMSGIVRLVSNAPGDISLTLATAFGRVPVLVAEDPEGDIGSSLVGARVAVRGVCATRLNERGQMIGMRLHCQQADDIAIVEPARDVASLPSVSPSRLLKYRAVADSSGRTRTKGVVTLRRGDGSFFIAGDGGAAFVRPVESTPLAAGDEVEVVGFARADDEMTSIEDAIVGRGPHGPRPSARHVHTVRELAEGSQGGELVRIETELFRVTQRERETIITARMEDDSGRAGGARSQGGIVELRLTNAEADRLPSALEPGARVAFVGIKWPIVSAMLGDKWPVLLVDSAQDVQLIASAPFLSPNGVISLVGLLAAAALGLAAVGRWRLSRKELVQAKLEAAVAERTGELEAASRRLAAFDAIRSRFVALANHELRSPLMVLRMRGELISRDGSPTTRVHGHDIVACADRITSIIDEFLEKPLDQGAPRIATDRVNLSDLARAAGARAEPLLRAKGQRLILDGTVRGVPAWGDARLVGTVLDNLLSNASKFSQPATEIRLSVRQSDEDRISSVSVIDQGPGLSEADRAKLFRRGVMLSARPTAGESGAGDGLAIAHELATAMAGRIMCESALGAGAEFRLELPGDAGPPRPWSSG
jgi:signal transduction histidine kinase